MVITTLPADALDTTLVSTQVNTIGIVRVTCIRADTTGLVVTKITSGAIASTFVAAMRMRSVLSPVNR